MLQTVQLKLSEAQQLALCLDDKIQENVECAQTLQAVAERYDTFYRLYNESCLKPNNWPCVWMTRYRRM